MALSRRLARPLLSSIFVVGGWDAFWNPAGKAKKAESVTTPLVEKTGISGLDSETVVRINGAVQVGAGVLLASGKFRRLAALVLIGSIVPTTYAGHRFWEESDPATRNQQRIHFFKNIGLLGGLILAAFDTEGEPSLAWRAKRHARQLESAVSVGRATRHRRADRARTKVAPAMAQISTSGQQTIRRGRAASRRAGRQLSAASHNLAETVAANPEVISHVHELVADTAKGSTETATQAVQQAASFVSNAARQLEPLIRDGSHPTVDAMVPSLASGAERVTETLSKLGEYLPTDSGRN